MKTTTILQLIGASAIAFAFTSCDSKEENLREDALEQKADELESQADATRKEGERAADAAEDHADRIRSDNPAGAENAERAADATREQTEKAADALEEEADSTREQK